MLHGSWPMSSVLSCRSRDSPTPGAHSPKPDDALIGLDLEQTQLRFSIPSGGVTSTSVIFILSSI